MSLESRRDRDSKRLSVLRRSRYHTGNVSREQWEKLFDEFRPIEELADF